MSLLAIVIDVSSCQDPQLTELLCSCIVIRINHPTGKGTRGRALQVVRLLKKVLIKILNVVAGVCISVE